MFNCFGISTLLKSSLTQTITKIQTALNQPLMLRVFHKSECKGMLGGASGFKTWFPKALTNWSQLKTSPSLGPYHQRKVPARRCSLASPQLLRRQIWNEVRLVIRSKPESHCYRLVHSLQIYPKHIAEAGWIPEYYLLNLKVCPDWFSARSLLASDAALLQVNKSTVTTFTSSARRVANAQEAHHSHTVSLNVRVGVCWVLVKVIKGALICHTFYLSPSVLQHVAICYTRQQKVS